MRAPGADQEFDAVIIADQKLDTGLRTAAELRPVVLDTLEEHGFHVLRQEQAEDTVIARARFFELETPGHMSLFNDRTGSRFHRDDYYLIVDLSRGGAIKCTMARRESFIADKRVERLFDRFVTDLRQKI